MTWHNPILLEPRFEVASRGESIRIPLDPSVPAELVGRIRFPAFLGEGLTVYVSEEPPTSLVFHSGREDWGYLDQESPERYLAGMFARHLPDFRLIVHYEDHVRYTLDRTVVTELAVRGGELAATDWPLAAIIPRARWLGLEVGHQWMRTEEELLLALAARPDASEELLRAVEAMVAADIAYALADRDPGVSSLFHVTDCFRRAAQLEAIGRGAAGLERLRAAAASIEESLLARLAAERGGSPASAADLAALEAELRLGPGSELAAVLAAIGPGPIGPGAALHAPARAAAETRAARRAPDWPAELAVVGQNDGARLCLDTRFRPSPLVTETDGEERFCELESGLFAFLAHG